MKNTKFYSENEYIYTHRHTYFRQLICSSYKDSLIGWYVNCDNIEYDKFAFQVKFDNQHAGVQFFYSIAGIQDPSHLSALERLEYELKNLGTDTGLVTMPMFDLFEYELDKVGSAAIPFSDPTCGLPFHLTFEEKKGLPIHLRHEYEVLLKIDDSDELNEFYSWYKLRSLFDELAKSTKEEADHAY